jgi:bifunctional DNA-binding transcriptional regulator/antitoxin component of YhaV-PrlF toxin-antitoxin module
MQTTAQSSTLLRLVRADEIGIPREFREVLGIEDATRLFLLAFEGKLHIIPVHADQHHTGKGSPGLRALYEDFAPVREEILASGVTQEELIAEIDAAIAEVRAERRAMQQ